MSKLKRFIPIVLIFVLMIWVYLSGLGKSLSYETIRYHHLEMQEYLKTNPIQTPFVFIGVYIFATTLSLPGGLLLSLIGGYLFPQPYCTIYVIIGATIGASFLFLSAKTALGDFLKKIAGNRMKKMESGFKKNAASYLLFLRLVPLFPFWLVNLAPAFFNVRLWTFIWTTVIGILPGTIVITLAGRGFNEIFETQEKFSISKIFNPKLTIALILLGVIALLPIFFKKKWGKKKNLNH